MAERKKWLHWEFTMYSPEWAWWESVRKWCKKHWYCLVAIALLLAFSIWSIVAPFPKLVEVRTVEIEAPKEMLAPAPAEPKIEYRIPQDVQDELKILREENPVLAAKLVAMEIPEIISSADIVGTITDPQTQDLLEKSCPSTNKRGGLRAVEYKKADLVPLTVFQKWLSWAQDKIEKENLGESWHDISALNHSLRQQPGGKNIPFNRVRRGEETLAAVVLYDDVKDKTARLFIFRPLSALNRISPSNPDYAIHYIHLD